MIRRLVVLMGISIVFLAATPNDGSDGPIYGFTAASAKTQHELEHRMDGFISADTMLAWLKQMSSEPNHVGAPHDRQNAEWMAAQFRSWGYTVRIDTYQVLFPTPTTRVLEMVAPTRFTPRLSEPILPQDATSKIVQGRLPPYNAYSADGDVTGELVYVNYGVPDDYLELERRGIDVKGKIVIARYGGSWRGIKPKVAAEHGAIGCIIYSDPRDDGYWEGDVYPKGPWRMEYGAQRGSVADMPTYPGDPLTPGVAATADAKRMSVQESPTVMKIPVLPLSYADAQPLLAALGGPVAPPAWRGALPLTYHMGPGPTRVHLKLAFDWSLKPVRDVIAVLTGSEAPDQWILRGNHYDAWVFGADDPLAGTVATLAEARAVGQLAKAGWRPRRTIVYDIWDGEEPGLLGSTEWVEDHAQELAQKAAVYINTDGNGRGFFGGGGSHALERMVTEVARDLVDPERHVSVLERRRAAEAVRDDNAWPHGDLSLGALGSGSDYTPFLQHALISSLNVGYGGESGGGSYHSVYDSFDHYTKFLDPGLTYGVMLAKTTGRLTLRLAQADVLPFRFTNLATTIGDYTDQVMKLADNLRKDTEHRNAMVERGAYTLAADPTEPYVPPEAKADVPYLNFAPLQNAAARLKEAASQYDSALASHMAAADLSSGTEMQLSGIVMTVERAFGDQGGLPRRPWFRHLIYAPGLYTGYGVKTLPGVREGIEQRKWDEVSEQMGRVAAAITRAAERIEEARKLLN